MKLNITAIKIQMARLGMSGIDIADKAHLAPTTVYSAIKRGQSSPKVIGKIALALDMPIETMVILEEETASSSL